MFSSAASATRLFRWLSLNSETRLLRSLHLALPTFRGSASISKLGSYSADPGSDLTAATASSTYRSTASVSARSPEYGLIPRPSSRHVALFSSAASATRLFRCRSFISETRPRSSLHLLLPSPRGVVSSSDPSSQSTPPTSSSSAAENLCLTFCSGFDKISSEEAFWFRAPLSAEEPETE